MEWETLPADLRERLDGELRQSRVLPAVQLLLAAGSYARTEAHRLIIERFHELYPPRPPAVPTLLRSARSLRDPVAAIEARWDADGRGWHVALVAIVERPGPSHERYSESRLGTFRHGGDLRLFGGLVPAWPESAEATMAGQAVARQLDVPFHFTNPSSPDTDLPRWWDTH
ncbi:hypothetical protein KZZ52_20220 [Dactylosporangium sp. AC04546]|uniref:hypothetical protein n=1 Tax=Dactylosporangium sp. AC04546 TaxID=2862460 RepID=UPI001EDE51A8|nr:hypothetical protein [Dactylosporangium sp. AC04546]WVK87622.1 hypothetical protein KZZ52_20220 [Dactylosporangium sp. AC04546]